MKLTGWFLLALMLFSAVCLSIIHIQHDVKDAPFDEEFFFGVSFGGNTTSEAKLLIDKVKGYTNLFVINSWDIATNETALTEICEYSIDAKMSIMVYFNFISRTTYAWHLPWLNTAKERWGNKFLGVYFYDEPGGKRIDGQQWVRGEVFENVSNYSEAAQKFVVDINSDRSMQDLKNNNIQVFTADYALYWFDYMAGYDTVFAELGWNNSRIQQIALCRGAANMQNKQWGTIITWTYNDPPYLASGSEIFQDMITSYRAGAKYIIVFNYPKINLHGILEEEHFTAMKKFWNSIHSTRVTFSKAEGQVALVLPKDYGWGMRNPDDKIWGIWPPDDLSPPIWNKMNRLLKRHRLELDIIYDYPQFNFKEEYTKIYLWNSTID